MDKDKFVEILMSIPQSKIKKDFLTTETQNYMELQDFPVKGTKVKLRIIRFQRERRTQTFRIWRAQDKYSGSFWTRGYQYNKTWDSLPNHEKGGVFKDLTPITNAAVDFTDFGVKKSAYFQDVFVLEYFTVSSTSAEFEKFKNIEIILFKFKKISQISAMVNSVTTP